MSSLRTLVSIVVFLIKLVGKGLLRLKYKFWGLSLR